MKRNPGFCPAEARDKRVTGTLRNGDRFGLPGWPADGRTGCRWSLTGHPHDIEFYEVLP